MSNKQSLQANYGRLRSLRQSLSFYCSNVLYGIFINFIIYLLVKFDELFCLTKTYNLNLTLSIILTIWNCNLIKMVMHLSVPSLLVPYRRRLPISRSVGPKNQFETLLLEDIDLIFFYVNCFIVTSYKLRN